MNFLFWNLNEKDNAKLIAAALEAHDIDVAAFAEHQSVDFYELCKRLHGLYCSDCPIFVPCEDD